MKKNKIKVLKRLLAVTLVSVLIISSSNLTAFASTDVTDGEKLVIIDKDGSITYQTLETQEQMSTDSNEDVIVVDTANNEYTVSQNDNQISTFASSGLEPVSDFSVSLLPYRNMCYIFSTFPDGYLYGSSGTLVSKNVVLASAHGVYNNEHGGKATSVLVAIGAYMDSGKVIAQSGVYQRKMIVLHEDWTAREYESADWSLIVLPEEFHAISYQGYGYSTDYTQSTGRNITLIGYPGGTRFCYSKGQITGTTNYKWNEANKGLWTTSAASENGMSGGPVIDDNTGVVIGIIKGKEKLTGTNVSIPLNKTITDAIQAYSK